MNEFSNRLQFLCPSFDLTEEEQRIFDRFYPFLADSGVADIIRKYVKNDTSTGGRPNVNYYNLFAAILYGFANGRSTLREIEDACGHDIRYINIMAQTRPSYSTIANFINTVIVPNENEIFRAINNQIIKELSITLDDAFIDGTKWEANANKYKFVWKPITYHKKISATFFTLLRANNICSEFKNEEMVRSSTITKALDTLEKGKESYDSIQYDALKKALNAILVKVLDYEEKESICGENRKSYYKTDHDATAMCLKSDYYSGLGSNMHAAYNVQAAVVKGLVLSYYVSQDRTDINVFIPTLEKFRILYGKYPLNVCADSGYGSLKNYQFLEKNGIGNYVKHSSWEGNISGSYPDSYRLIENNLIVCLGGKTGGIIDIPDRHPKKAGGVFYKVDGCLDCEYKQYCMRFMKDIENQVSRVFEVNVELTRLKQEAEQNLLSPKGIEIRVNRSVQAEGIFGIEKQDYQYVRTRRRGREKVSAEIMLVFLGLNLKRLLRYYKTGKVLSFWIAPEDLMAQKPKNPSAKRLAKKGKRIHDKTYNIQIKQAKLV